MNHRRKIISAIVLGIFVALPVTAAASSSDDLYLEMLRALDGPVAVQPKVTATSTASTTVPAVAKPAAAKSFSTAVPPPKDEVLAPGHLFNLDGNAPVADAQVDGMKAALALLTAQFASLLVPLQTQASSTPTVSVNASSNEPLPVPKMTFTKDLTVGSRGDDVRKLQVLLIARGFLFGETTGYYGVLTKTAVIAFQMDNGLPPVGNVGPRTRAVLSDMPQGPGEAAPQLIIGPPARQYTSSSTSVRFNTSTSTGTSTPMFDPFYPPVSVSMSILPSEAPVGGTVALTWLSQNATSCAASDGWDGPRPTLGAARIEPLKFSLNFVITCQGPGGIASTSALVVVGGEQ